MFDWMRQGMRQAVLVLAGGLIAGPMIVAPQEAQAAPANVAPRTACSYDVVHVDTRLRVRADAYVGAPIVGHLYPGQRARGECWPMWSVGRYWIHLAEPFEGYAAASYLRTSILRFSTSRVMPR